MNRQTRKRLDFRNVLLGAAGCALIANVCLAGTKDHWLSVHSGDCTVWSDKPLAEGRTILWNGGCEAGKLAGEGVLEVVADGKTLLRFEGRFVQGKAEGEGTLDTQGPEGTTHYRGGFVASLKDGEGLFELPDGSRYWGGFKDDEPNGSGVYQGADGSVYLGEIRGGLPQGQGLMVFRDGEAYKGEFAAGKRQGRGVLVFPNDSVFRGAFADGKADGRGIFLSENGSVYDGTWKKGKADGRFAVTTPDGRQEQQLWREDTRVIGEPGAEKPVTTGGSK
jgi:hypothetical protein